MNLSPNFTLESLIRSSTADRLGIDNTPSNEIRGRLAQVCREILEPVRAHYNRPVIVNSGYRCLSLNRTIGSKDTSQHTQGYAVDFEVPEIDNDGVAIWVRDFTDFDQLIREYPIKNVPDSGWIHVSFTGNNHRKSVLTIDKNGTSTGLK